MGLIRRILLITSALIPRTHAFSVLTTPKTPFQLSALPFSAEQVDVCVIGGGVSGLVAATEAAKTNEKVVLLEASPTLGGRVQSDVTDDGFVLDRGFAVFIEEYPVAKQMLDYDDLKLQKFLPGALVKVPDSDTLARVADPLRQPLETFNALVAPVGSLIDKIKLLPLIFHSQTTPLEELFAETETDTYTTLTQRWGLGPDMVQTFFRPFLEGIYLAPLRQQSSRMFHFVFKMFSIGAATLPTGGMQAVANQLTQKAQTAGVDVRTQAPVTSLTLKDDEKVFIKVDKVSNIIANKVIVATESTRALELLQGIDGTLQTKTGPTPRSVSCRYYSFRGEAPVTDPILILNGIGDGPVNNVCFPSVVNPSYAPTGSHLCSVTLLQECNDDDAVREQLASWFPAHHNAILQDWKLEGTYTIPYAQPSQVDAFPAIVNGGRDPNRILDTPLPSNVWVCGDYMATATLNGALESGLRAGKAAA